MTLGSCDRSTPVGGAPGTPANAASTALGPADQTYTTRGVITTLPPPPSSAAAQRAGLGQMLSIHHESIPTFKNKFGETQPMKSHDMPFPNLADGLSLDGLAVGDKVELTFEVRWKHEKTWVLTRLAKIASETPLDLGGRAATPVPEPATATTHGG